MEHYEQLLLHKRDEILGKFANREEITAERSSDTLDDVQRYLEREFAVTTLNRDWETFKKVELALERIRLGEYGICMRCEEEISGKRLQAIPWTPLCLNCQQLEDEKQREEQFEYALSDAA